MQGWRAPPGSSPSRTATPAAPRPSMTVSKRIRSGSEPVVPDPVPAARPSGRRRLLRRRSRPARPRRPATARRPEPRPGRRLPRVVAPVVPDERRRSGVAGIGVDGAAPPPPRRLRPAHRPRGPSVAGIPPVARSRRPGGPPAGPAPSGRRRARSGARPPRCRPPGPTASRRGSRPCRRRGRRRSGRRRSARDSP